MNTDGRRVAGRPHRVPSASRFSCLQEDRIADVGVQRGVSRMDKGEEPLQRLLPLAHCALQATIVRQADLGRGIPLRPKARIQVARRPWDDLTKLSKRPKHDLWQCGREPIVFRARGPEYPGRRQITAFRPDLSTSRHQDNSNRGPPSRRTERLHVPKREAL